MDIKNETSCEPMDIDLSSHSVSAMDISNVDSSFDISPVTIKKEKNVDDCCDEDSYSNIKHLSINKSIKEQKQHTNNSKRSLCKLLACVIVIFLSVIFHQFSQFKCNENLNFNLIKDTLQSKLYGQTVAVDSLIKALESEVAGKLIILYGGTGVGKTYTASLILENLLEYSNVYHYTMPSFLQTSFDFMFGLSFCESSLVVVDDLNRQDILNIKNNINTLVKKSEELSKKITILLLYNCDTMDEHYFKKCDHNFVQELNQTLGNVGIVKYFIKFESLSEEHLRLCIANELSNTKLSETDIFKIVKNFNVDLDGCKGVYQKMKYLNVI